MMTQSKIIIVGDSIFVRVPYKHGSVVWELNTNTNQWHLRQHGEYSPKKVSKFHRQYLNGFGLYNAIRKLAAASHQYRVLDFLRKRKYAK